ncbi:unnamed protein product, partial [Ilex paraguariensis]
MALQLPYWIGYVHDHGLAASAYNCSFQLKQLVSQLLTKVACNSLGSISAVVLSR